MEGRKGLYPKERRGAPLTGAEGNGSWAGKNLSHHINSHCRHLWLDSIQVKRKEYDFALQKIFISSSKDITDAFIQTQESIRHCNLNSFILSIRI